MHFFKVKKAPQGINCNAKYKQWNGIADLQDYVSCKEKNNSKAFPVAVQVFFKCSARIRIY